MTTTWSYGGTALSTFGKVTVINNYLDFVERRGEDMLIPHNHGLVHVDKYYNSRQMSFSIALYDTSATALEATIDALKKLLSPSTTQTLSHTMANGTIRTIPAIVNSTFEPDRITGQLMKYVVTFDCPDPFFRLSTAIADNTTTINASPKAMVVNNPGGVIEYNPTIILTGPLTNPVITNSTNGFVLTYTGAISAGHTVTIGKLSGEYYATHSVSGSVIGSVDHNGGAEFMRINMGNNSLSITSDVTTTGTVKVTFYEPYL